MGQQQYLITINNNLIKNKNKKNKKQKKEEIIWQQIKLNKMLKNWT